MQSKQKRKLQNYLINRDFQLPLIIMTFLYTFLIVIITEIIIFIPSIKGMFAEDLATQYRSAQIFIESFSFIVPGIIVILFVFIIYQIWFTHRICGPIIPFTRALERASERKLNVKIQLRKHDFLKSVAKIFNNTFNTFRNDIVEIKRYNEKTGNLLEKIFENAKHLDNDTIKILKEVSNIVNIEKEKLNEFIT